MNTIYTGDEVTKKGGGGRGVVVDGIAKKSGPNKGRIEVMWIGGRYTVAEWPEDLALVQPPEPVADDNLEAKLAYARKGRDALSAENKNLKGEIIRLNLVLGAIKRVVNEGSK